MELKKHRSLIFWTLVLTVISFASPALAITILILLVIKYIMTNIGMMCAKRYVPPLFFITLIGALSGIGSVFGETPVYFYLRDGFYFILPIVALCAGIGICKDSDLFATLLRAVVVSCLIYTVYHYYDYIIASHNYQILSLDVRYKYGLDSSAAIIGFIVMLVYYQNSSILYNKISDRILILCFVIAVVVSLSRTNILIAVVALIIPTVTRFISSKLQICIIFAFAFMIIFGSSFIDVSTKMEAAQTFNEKISKSISEIYVRNLYTMQEINENWRAYEAFLGIEKFLSGSVFEYLFGQGFGSSVSGSHVFDEKLQTIPIFHNGFVTIILKTGIVGIVIYFIFYLKIAINNENKNLKHDNELIVSLINIICISLLIKTFFVMGIYTSKSNLCELIMLGAALRCVYDKHSTIKLSNINTFQRYD